MVPVLSIVVVFVDREQSLSMKYMKKEQHLKMDDCGLAIRY